MQRQFVTLMYHEISRLGRPLCRSDAGYVRYVVEERQFRGQIQRIGELGLRGMSVGEMRSPSEVQRIALTFDDGCASDLDMAAPVLLEFGFSATAYITRDFIGKRGFMTAPQIRELSQLGFEIGCHGATHRYLTDLPPDELNMEVFQARQWLQDITGTSVYHFSCPGGRWNDTVLNAVRSAGFESMATSEPGLSVAGAYQLSRSAVFRHSTSASFDRLVLGHGLGSHRMKTSALRLAKHVLGNKHYERIRNLILGEGLRVDTPADKSSQ